MHLRIITNTTNGVGLQRDAEILRDVLVPEGHEVELCHFRDAPPPGKADVALFVEIIAPQYLGCAELTWFMPNPEWFHFGWKTLLNHVDLVLCKTRQTQRVFEALRCECVFTGFTSRDMLDSTVKRERRFLHVAGKSQTKNTKAIICAWTQSLPAAAHLTLVSRDFAEFASGIPHITVHSRVTDDELRVMMNSHQFHLCPSAAEGWGHYIHEAMSCGAVAVTTDGEPMNELACCLKVPATTRRNMSLVPLWDVSPTAMRQAVLDCLNLSTAEVRTIGSEARWAFEQERERFGEVLPGVFDDAIV